MMQLNQQWLNYLAVRIHQNQSRALVFLPRSDGAVRFTGGLFIPDPVKIFSIRFFLKTE